MIESTVHSLQPLASWVLFASLKSGVVIPLVLLVRRLCARWLTPQGRYGLWFALLACLSIPFGGQLEIRRETRIAMPAPVQVITSSVAASHELPIIRIEDAPAAAAADLSLASKAVLIWLLGAASLAGVVGYNVHRYRRIRSRASHVDAQTDEFFQRCRQLLKLRRHVGILETSQVSSPLVIGWWRPTLLLPRTLSTQISNEQLRLVLLHELAHVRRHDILVNWVVTLVQVLHWFNPLAWYALRIMRNDMEHACDAGVLAYLSANERAEYGNALIRLSDLTPRRALLTQNAGIVESLSQLKSRISMIAQYQPRGAFSTILGGALITLMCSIAVTQAATAPQQPASTASQAAPAAAAKQGTPAPTATPSLPIRGAQAPRTMIARPAKTAEKATALESAVIPIRYAKATDLVPFVRPAAGIGLLSDKGSVAADDSTNTLFVLDTSSKVATIRQLVASLDVPVQEIVVNAVFAFVDNDLVQELTAGKVPGGSWSPATDLGPDQAVTAALNAAQLAHRAEIFSAPRLVVANRARASIEQSAAIPPGQEVWPGINAKDMHLSFHVTPTVVPGNRVALDIDATMDMIGTVIVTTGGVNVPSIDTRQVKNQVVLDSGATVMLDVVEGRAGNMPGATPGRRLVAFVTPTLLTDAAAAR